jgi:hypothetical protein
MRLEVVCFLVCFQDLFAKREVEGAVQRSSLSLPVDLGFAARLEGDVDLDVLRDTLRMNGLPEAFRKQCWELLLGYRNPDKTTRGEEMSLFRRKYLYWCLRCKTKEK